MDMLYKERERSGIVFANSQPRYSLLVWMDSWTYSNKLLSIQKMNTPHSYVDIHYKLEYHQFTYWLVTLWRGDLIFYLGAHLHRIMIGTQSD